MVKEIIMTRYMEPKNLIAAGMCEPIINTCLFKHKYYSQVGNYLECPICLQKKYKQLVKKLRQLCPHKKWIYNSVEIKHSYVIVQMRECSDCQKYETIELKVQDVKLDFSNI